VADTGRTTCWLPTTLEPVPRRRWNPWLSTPWPRPAGEAPDQAAIGGGLAIFGGGDAAISPPATICRSTLDHHLDPRLAEEVPTQNVVQVGREIRGQQAVHDWGRYKPAVLPALHGPRILLTRPSAIKPAVRRH
jgi:hypothetical protein